MTPSQAVGAAMAVLAGGADLVYLFNYFPESKPWPTEPFNTTLRAMRNQESLAQLPRTHAVTYRDVRAPGEPADNALPATGTRAAFRLQTGPKPQARKVEVLLELDATDTNEIVPPAVRVNGTACAALARDGAAVFRYLVPKPALADGAHVVEAEAGGGKPFKIVRVEIVIGPST
jgi:hypothetical protein